MEVSAAPARTIAWECPECGHGSPELRDQAAHLDAHRQLQQFFRAWDDAVATDARAGASNVRRRRLRVVLAFAVLCVVALVVAGLAGGGGAPSRPTAAGVPVPGVDLPRETTPPAATDADAAPPPDGPTAVQGPAGAPAAGPASRPPSPTAAVPDVPAFPTPVPAPTGAAPTGTVGGSVPATAPASAARPAPTLRTCLLGVCITVH